MLTLTRRSTFSDTAKHEAVEAFTWGDCGYLALAVSAKTGLDVATASVDSHAAWVHCGVWISETHIADIKGIHTVQDWLSDWEWAADNGWGYQEYFAVRWTDLSEIAEYVELGERVYPEVDIDFWADWVVANIRAYRDL